MSKLLILCLVQQYGRFITNGFETLYSKRWIKELIKENAYEVDANGMVNLSEKYLSKRNLNNTDWKMIRHRDQLAQGIHTSLSDEQYQELLIKRQNWREKASD